MDPSGNPLLPLTDVGATPPPLASLRLLSAGSAQTLGGTFYNMDGKRVGVSFSLAVPAAVGAGASASLPAIPQGAVGVKFTGLTAGLYYDYPDAGASAADFLAFPSRYPVCLPDPEYVSFGRVG